MSAQLRHTEAQKPPKRVFFAAVLVIFFSALSTADSVGFVPNYIDGTSSASPRSISLASLPQLGPSTNSGQADEPLVVSRVEPVRIVIDAIGLDLPVQNPDTRDVETLDALLLQGPARYVDSAKLGENGNMIIFAHSSRLPIVHNKMFQAFNNIPELKIGDSIILKGADGKSYLYSVESVAKASVGDGTTLDLSPSQGKRLTLVTCDTLTGKSARYILEAQFVGII